MKLHRAHTCQLLSRASSKKMSAKSSRPTFQLGLTCSSTLRIVCYTKGNLKADHDTFTFSHISVSVVCLGRLVDDSGRHHSIGSMV
jgi:hypothetical protein